MPKNIIIFIVKVVDWLEATKDRGHSAWGHFWWMWPYVMFYTPILVTKECVKEVPEFFRWLAGHISSN